MKRVFAILAEPASYTVDRNKAVYDPMGMRYAYIHSKSVAKAVGVESVKSYSELSLCELYKKMRRLVRENDVIIMNGYMGRTFWMLFLANIFKRKPIGIDSDTPLIIPANPIKRLVKSVLLRFLFSRKWMYGLPGGNHGHKDLFRYYGMPEDRIFLMPMMVNNERFYFTGERPAEPFTFLYVGRLVGFKHTPLMVQAFIKAFAGNDKVHLRVVGDGEYMQELQTLSQGHNNIHLLGAKFGRDLENEYHNAHVFVLPSTYEMWGLVVNEAMAASMPVIVSDTVGSGYDLVQGQNTGLVFKDNDVDSLAECMKRITDDKQLYQQMSKNAYHFMHDHWNYDLYRDCITKFIESV